MDEATVQLLCPDCDKSWHAVPGGLPGTTEPFDCPGCQASRRTAEFMRTDRDLRTLKQLG